LLFEVAGIALGHIFLKDGDMYRRIQDGGEKTAQKSISKNNDQATSERSISTLLTFGKFTLLVPLNALRMFNAVVERRGALWLKTCDKISKRILLKIRLTNDIKLFRSR
jgi:hypothetical protein